VSDVVGIELSTDVVRAVARDRWRLDARRTFECGWDPTRPTELVALLRAQLGAANRIALAVGLGFLHSKNVKLPPAPLAERRRMLALEPDRFFPVQNESLVTTLSNDENLAFAVNGEQLENWVQAFESWAPVESVEPGPVALARALGKASLEGSFALDAGAAEVGLVEIQEKRLHSVRRIPQEEVSPDVQALPAGLGVAAEYLTALGAANGVNGVVDAMLLSDTLSLRVKRRRQQRTVVTAVLCAATLGLALWALNGSRERTLERITGQLAEIAPRAQPAESLRGQLLTLEREAVAIGELTARRPNPLLVLAALSERLPEGATVLNAKAKGADWQIDGTARDAAAIIPLLDQDERFENVRFLSASARFRDRNRTYETFSIAFRVRAGT
jgi:type IV pilus assembly PilN-like protein